MPWAAALPSIIGAAGAIGGGLLAGQAGKGTSGGYTQEQKDWIASLLNRYGAASKKGPNVYEGTRVAPLTEQQKAMTDTSAFSGVFDPYQNTDLYNQGTTALSGIVSGTSGAQPYTDTQMANRWATAYKPQYDIMQGEDVAATRNEMGGPGTYWGNARSKQLQDVREKWNAQMRPAYAQYMAGMEDRNQQIAQQKLANSLAGISATPEYEAAPTTQNLQRLGGRQAGLSLAGITQQQQQNEINAAMTKFVEENQITDPQVIQVMLQLLGQGAQSATSGNPFAASLANQLGKSSGQFISDFASGMGPKTTQSNVYSAYQSGQTG